MSESIPQELLEKYEHRIIDILNDSDLETISAKKIRVQLEQEFSTSVAPYKQVLDDKIVEHFKRLRDKSSEVANKEKKKKKKNKKKVEKKANEAPKPLSGIALPKKLSPILSEIVNEPALSRLQVSKYLWVYIKKHNLQDPSNGRVIVCDDKMKELFGKDRLTMFEMSGLIGPHLLDCPPEDLEAYKVKFNIPDKKVEQEE